MEWRAAMESLSPSTINVRLSAVRKMVGEARRAGMIGQEEAASLTDIPNISQKGTRLGNWLTREQAKELLAVPDRSTLKGKRDYVILALLVGCALRRNELAELDVETIQQREGRWVLADLEGKGRRIRTVAIPIWVKHGINAWIIAAGIEDGRLLRSVSKSGKVNRDTLSDWAVWSVVEQSSKQIGIEHFGAHDLCRTCAKLCRKNGGDLEHASPHHPFAPCGPEPLVRTYGSVLPIVVRSQRELPLPTRLTAAYACPLDAERADGTSPEPTLAPPLTDQQVPAHPRAYAK
jgi:integrase